MDMLELTPVDIRHKEFSTGLAGYKKEEVREFLELVAHQMEDLQTRCSGIEQERKQFEDKRQQWEIDQRMRVLDPIREDEQDYAPSEPEQKQEEPAEPEPVPQLEPEPEPTPVVAAEPAKPLPSEDLISRTLILAEKIKEEILGKAERDAENIIKSAELRAERIVDEARGYLGVLEEQYVTIKGKKKQFLLNFRDELQKLMDSLNRETLLRSELEHALDTQFAKLHEAGSAEVEQSDDKPPFGID